MYLRALVVCYSLHDFPSLLNKTFPSLLKTYLYYLHTCFGLGVLVRRPSLMAQSSLLLLWLLSRNGLSLRYYADLLNSFCGSPLYAPNERQQLCKLLFPTKLTLKYIQNIHVHVLWSYLTMLYFHWLFLLLLNLNGMVGHGENTKFNSQNSISTQFNSQ